VYFSIIFLELGTKIVEQYPDLPQWIQGYIDDGIKQPDMPRELSDDHGITVKYVQH
jgi:hypothetical protein